MNTMKKYLSLAFDTCMNMIKQKDHNITATTAYGALNPKDKKIIDLLITTNKLSAHNQNNT